MWNFWIDVGGTFTDCIGISPTGTLHQFKTLSSGLCKGRVKLTSPRTIQDDLRAADPEGFWSGVRCRLLADDGCPLSTLQVERYDATTGSLHLESDIPETARRYELLPDWPAPVLGIRWLLGLPADADCPAVRVRFGTTRGTNALLTRTGAKTALLITEGFQDLPLIGNQDRPELFDLDIRKPMPLFESVVEVQERLSADGQVLKPLDANKLRAQLKTANLTPDKFDSVAVCLLHAWQNSEHEQLCADVLKDAGFTEISCSHDVSPLIRMVPRCDTTVLDAYLNPVLREYLDLIAEQLPGSSMQVMTSAGGLVDRTGFRGRDSLLSGPAGGIVGFSAVAREEGFRQAIGFDMGGTSTDVARFAGQFEFETETEKAGVRIMTPTLAIETVAAGGGSVCGFDGSRLFVGPQSAGADPGPACYGAGGPLTVTDLNVFLGRVDPEFFPFPLHRASVEFRLSELHVRMRDSETATAPDSLEELAEGLLEIANDNMAQAIRKVSVAKGFDPAVHVLVSFGGAGGQHACSIAAWLMMKQILIHPLAGILSAYGMGQADVRVIRQQNVLSELTDDCLRKVAGVTESLRQSGSQSVQQQGVAPEQIHSMARVELRYSGTDSALTVELTGSSDEPVPDALQLQERFEAAHRRQFGFIRSDRAIEVVAVQVETVGRSGRPVELQRTTEDASSSVQQTRKTRIYIDGRWHEAVIHKRSELQAGMELGGPCLVCEPTSTILIDLQSTATVLESGCLLIQIDPGTNRSDAKLSDAVRLEVFNNQFVSIAEQMGETLRRTSTSTNVRERLDFSCAIFDGDGRLVVNAPHVPVHLGAMGETVRAIRSDHADMRRGDVFVTNDPYRGGSHLPDVTVVTPVFASERSGQPDFFVANRAHHAEIGGIVPGSMPPFSKTLAEEGVLIRSRRLVDAGESCEDELRQLLSSGPWPSRAVDDNLADLNAQVAANEVGLRLLVALSDQHTVDVVRHFMKQVQQTSAIKMRQCLSELQDGVRQFEDRLDDGHRIKVCVCIDGDTATIDFSGTDGVHCGNLNANRAITTAAVLYSLRCLLNQNVPLNDGVLEPITLQIPDGLLNPRPGPSADTSPAMVGGNVETSQRIVDVVLGAFELAAASQGTMNNLTFGNDRFGYYETICGGAGATNNSAGADAVHTHMTNTRLTDPEILEQRYPVQLNQFCIRTGSGGAGRHRGGHGIVRELQFLDSLNVALLAQRRTMEPWGLNDGGPGLTGSNRLRRSNDADWELLPGSFSISIQPGDRLRIETPGGGGCGAVVSPEE